MVQEEQQSNEDREILHKKRELRSPPSAFPRGVSGPQKATENRILKLEKHLKLKFKNCFQKVRKAFLALDSDYDGFVTVEDMLRFFGNDPNIDYDDLKKLITDKD